MATSRSKKPVVFAFSGVGATGKTSVISTVREMHAPPSVAYAPSFTREGATARGLTEAKAFESLNAERFAEFQVYLFEYAVAASSAFITQARNNPRTRAIILERTPIDNLAYLCSHVSASLFSRYLLLRQVQSWIKRHNPTIFYTPYPPPFKASTDSFRKPADESLNTAFNIELLTIYRELRIEPVDLPYADTLQQRAEPVLSRLSSVMKASKN